MGIFVHILMNQLTCLYTSEICSATSKFPRKNIRFAYNSVVIHVCPVELSRQGNCRRLVYTKDTFYRTELSLKKEII